MSNIIAGEVFEKVIQEVINASQNDFEENGVQQQTLTELQQSWQHKLSQRAVAQMPWDPKPVAPPPQSQQPTPSPITPAQNAPIQHQAPPNGQSPANGQPRVKPEPGQDPQQQMHNYPPAQGYPPQVNNQMMAQQRAASLLQQQFGPQANASLNAMQQRGIALPGGGPNMQQQQQQRPQGLQMPGQPGGQAGQNPQQQQQQRQMQAHAQAQYAQQMRQQTAHQQPQVKTEGNGQYPQQSQHPGVNYSQTDGADEKALDEWNAFMTHRRQVSATQVAQNDRLMRSEIEALRRRLDNGLMLPLDQHKSVRSRKRELVREQGQTTSTISTLPTIPQLDGEGEEDDEDAINSDLDSSSDEAKDGDDEEDEIDQMLCTYDKVQRVKNKWKCTLKDGILLANGKEYLFHKAQGEFEW